MGVKRTCVTVPVLLPWALLLLLPLLSPCVTVNARHRTSKMTSSGFINATPATTTNNSNNNNNTNHHHYHHIRRRHGDEMSLKLRKDGLRELRVAYGDVLMLETSPPLLPHHPDPLPSASSPSGGAVQRLLQVTDGTRVVHSVREKGGHLRDCRWSSDPADVAQFVQEYHRDRPRHRHSHALSRRTRHVLTIYDNLQHRDSARVVTFRDNVTRGTRRHRKRNRLLRGMSVKVTTPRSLGRFARYLHVSGQVRECQKFQSRVRRYLRRKGSVLSRGVVEEEGGGSSRRRKRDLMTGWFIFPGTKWCGSGDIAEHPDDLGYDEALDSCCRDHDLCPHIIPRFTWRFGLFNFHLHTLSHCRCDRRKWRVVTGDSSRFRRCLKKSRSPAAHMVGKIFFNVVGSQCFKFSKQRACKRRHWWGQCKKYGFTKVAQPRKQRAF